ncbi:hypothetical protein SAMN06309944_0720 [Micrococcales bacterium KH10]|nr:hypothetical protein SAMN06309944_0720 [Micrococcales bacterium KH10]
MKYNPVTYDTPSPRASGKPTRNAAALFTRSSVRIEANLPNNQPLTIMELAHMLYSR